MRNKLGTVFSVLLIWTLLLCRPQTAMAAGNMQDGIDVVLTTDQTGYDVGDTVGVTINVTNTNGFAVDHIRVAADLPDGLKLMSGDTAVAVGTLLAGEARQLHLTAAIPQGHIYYSPQTGDGSSTLLWIVLMITAGGIAALLIFRKKTFAAKIFSLFLCLALVLSVMSPATFAAAAEKSLSVKETITVAGVSKTITATVAYDWNNPAPAAYSVTLENDGNGTASASQTSAAAGTQITITAVPSAGYQFKQWVVADGDMPISDTNASTASFTMPEGDVTIRADFEPTLQTVNAEAAKITGYTAGTNTKDCLVFDPVINGTLATGAVINLITVKAGPTGGSHTSLKNAAISTSGTLSLPTQGTVDAVGLSANVVYVTFTVTLGGTTSDARTLDISGFFSPDSTAGKLRADKGKLGRAGHAAGDVAGISLGFSGSVPLFPAIQMSPGVAIPETDLVFNGSVDHATIRAEAGGEIMLRIDNAVSTGLIGFRNIPLTCDGTAYTYVHGDVNEWMINVLVK